MSPITEQVFLAQPAVTARGRVISSPFQFQFTGEDRIVVLMMSSVTTALVTRWRFQELDGTITVIQREHTAVGDRLPHSESFAMGHGFVTNCVVTASDPAVQTGQVYVVVYVARTGGTAPGLLVGQLLGGYTTRFATLAWPGSPIVDATEGQGRLLTFDATPISAGNPVTLNVPNNTRWAVKSIYGDFASNIGANVLLYCLMHDGATIIARVPAFAEQATGTTVRYTWARGLALAGQAAGIAAGIAIAPLPVELIISSGDQILVTKDNPSGLFTWSQVGVQVQEWLSF